MITNSVLALTTQLYREKKHNKDSIHDGSKMLSKCLNERAGETGLGEEVRCSDWIYFH